MQTFTPKCPTVCCTQSKIQITDADPSKNMIIFFVALFFPLSYHLWPGW